MRTHAPAVSRVSSTKMTRTCSAAAAAAPRPRANPQVPRERKPLLLLLSLRSEVAGSLGMTRTMRRCFARLQEARCLGALVGQLEVRRLRALLAPSLRPAAKRSEADSLGTMMTTACCLRHPSPQPRPRPPQPRPRPPPRRPLCRRLLLRRRQWHPPQPKCLHSLPLPHPRPPRLQRSHHLRAARQHLLGLPTQRTEGASLGMTTWMMMLCLVGAPGRRAARVPSQAPRKRLPNPRPGACLATMMKTVWEVCLEGVVLPLPLRKRPQHLRRPQRRPCAPNPPCPAYSARTAMWCCRPTRNLSLLLLLQRRCFPLQHHRLPLPPHRSLPSRRQRARRLLQRRLLQRRLLPPRRCPRRQRRRNQPQRRRGSLGMKMTPIPSWAAGRPRRQRAALRGEPSRGHAVTGWLACCVVMHDDPSRPFVRAAHKKPRGVERRAPDPINPKP